jgi:translation initiation factor IF-2
VQLLATISCGFSPPLLAGAAPYQEVEEVTGTATVLATFPLSVNKSKLAELGSLEGGPKIAGVRVMEGQLKRSASFVRVLRDGKEVARVGVV